MENRDVLVKYYEYANSGDWDRWCDLFAENMVMDEQLAGHVEGRETLRAMMRNMGDMYSSFQNRPSHLLVDGDQAAAVSHLSARSAGGDAIESEVMNYFRISGGEITYMSNYHDTAPFQVLSG
jgi:ketosteroid isomerase-like protein